MKNVPAAIVAVILVILTVLLCGSSADAADAKPIRALLVTGGSSHDYDNQKLILTEGIAVRTNIEWTIAHQGGKDRNKKIPLFLKKGWADGYDVVVHTQCFGGVVDVPYVESIASVHQAGVPAVMIHCTPHSYRNAKTDEWRKVVGVSSFSHEKHRALSVRNQAAKHPIMLAFPKEWKTPNGELYKIDKLWPGVTPLASAFGVDTQKDHVCIWINTHEKMRVFGTTIGHHNETMRTEVYLDLVTRGLLWACKKLDEKGQPLDGYDRSAGK